MANPDTNENRNRTATATRLPSRFASLAVLAPLIPRTMSAFGANDSERRRRVRAKVNDRGGKIRAQRQEEGRDSAFALFEGAVAILDESSIAFDERLLGRDAGFVEFR